MNTTVIRAVLRNRPSGGVSSLEYCDWNADKCIYGAQQPQLGRAACFLQDEQQDEHPGENWKPHGDQEEGRCLDDDELNDC